MKERERADSLGGYVSYPWISLFYSALSPKGRAGFVTVNSADDAHGTELEMRKKLLTAPCSVNT